MWETFIQVKVIKLIIYVVPNELTFAGSSLNKQTVSITLKFLFSSNKWLFNIYSAPKDEDLSVISSRLYLLKLSETLRIRTFSTT